MAEPDAFDPTHALDGWRAPAPAPVDLELRSLPRAEDKRKVDTEIRLVGLVGLVAEPDAFDPARALDGWRAPAPAPLDLELKSLQQPGNSALNEDKVARLKARGYEMVDVEDVEVTDVPLRPVIAALVLDLPPSEPPAEPNPPSVFEDDVDLVDELTDEPPPVFAEASVLEAQPHVPPVEPDVPQDVEPIRLFEEPPAVVETLAELAEVPVAPVIVEQDEQPDLLVLPDATAVAVAPEEPPPEVVQIQVLDVPASSAPVEPDLQPPVEAEVPLEAAPAMEVAATPAEPADEEGVEPPEASQSAVAEVEAVQVSAEPELSSAVVDSAAEAEQPSVTMLAEPEPEPLSVDEDVEPPETQSQPIGLEDVDLLDVQPPQIVEVAEPEVEAVPLPAEPELPSAAIETLAAAEEPSVMALAEPEPLSPPTALQYVELLDAPLPEIAEVAEPEVEAVPLAGEPEPLLVAEAVEPLAAQPQPMALEDAEPPDASLPEVVTEPEIEALPVPTEPGPAVVEAVAALEEPAKEIEVPEVPTPAAAETPVPDFPAPPPQAEPDLQWLIDSIRLPEVARPAVFETPVLDFHLAPPPPEPDPRQLLDAIAMPVVPPQPTTFETPVLDMAALTPQVKAEPRLLAQWQPQAWMTLARRISDANTEVLQTPDGLHVHTHAPQWLCAAWPPQEAQGSWLGRWPELAVLVSAETREEALKALLGELPAEASLWASELEADWLLVAELVLQQDGGLRPAQAKALRELAEAERGASLERLRSGYQPDGRVARRRP